LSGDPGQEHFADGISEDIIAALSRFRWFFVVARNSSFVYKGRPINVKLVARELGVRYVLEGSVRRSVEQVRISAHLIDATSGNQLFASRRDFDVADIFAMQDQIAERVAGAVEPELLKAEAGFAATRLRAGEATGWDLARHGIGCMQQATKAAYLRGRELLREACRRDPDLPEAHVWLAHASAGMIIHGWSGSGAADGERESMDAALKALQLDDKSPYAHYALAISSAYQDAPDQAVRAAEKALELCPALALAHLVLGLTYLLCGDAGAAIGPLERGLDINPYDPQNFLWCSLLALAYLFDRNPDAALQRAEKALKIRPTWRPAVEAAACCSLAAGRAEMGRQCAARMTGLEDSPSDVLALLKRRNPRWRDEMAALLCAAEGAP
jgi:TolB-like protein